MTSGGGERRTLAERAGVAWLALGVAALAVLPFFPALQNGFVSWDDELNFVNNPWYRGLGWPQLKWMWTTFHLGHYVPLSWMTLGLDHVLWGMDARGYHLTSLVLHGANTAVIFLIARRLLGAALREDRGSTRVTLAAAFATMCFAVHPLRVESVAWVTERRDVLSGLFYSLAVLTYLRVVESAPVTSRRYAAIFGLFIAALLSKATAMTLPAVLLVINVYPLRRFDPRTWRSAEARLVYRELAPLATLTVAAMLLSLMALRPGPQLGVVDKLAVSAYGLAFYLWKTLAPVGLAPLYPMPIRLPAMSTPFLMAYAVVAALLVMAWTERKRWPGAVSAGVAFVAIILPMLGIVQNGPQLVADRYTYHASPALGLLAGAGFALAWNRRQLATVAAGVVVLGVLGTLTWAQTRIWRDSYSLWSHTIRVAESAIAHDGLGTVFLRRDSAAKALAHYERATQLNPYYAEAHANAGLALSQLNRFDEAGERFKRALEIKPDFDNAENNWGAALAHQGNLVAAVGHYRLALSMNPKNASAEYNWGNALLSGGNPRHAIDHFRRAVELSPVSADAEAGWGTALAQLGQLDEAILHFQRALKLNPADRETRRLMDKAVAQRQRQSGAGVRQ